MRNTRNLVLKSSLLAVSLALYSGVYADAMMPSDGSVIPPGTPGFGISLTGLDLQPNANNLTYAIFTNPLPVDHPNWAQEEVKTTFHPAFDFGLNYMMADGVDQVHLDWLHFSSSNDASVVGDGATGSVSPPYWFGPGAQFTGAMNASSTAKFNVDNIDLVFQHFVNVDNHLQVAPFFGLSSAYLKEDLTDNYTGSANPSDPTPFNITSDNISKYKGIGPRLGLDTTYFVSQHFGVTAEMGGALLIGSQESDTTFNSCAGTGCTPQGTTLSDTSHIQMVPELDGKLGLTYQTIFNSGSKFDFEAGYMLKVYINAIDQVVPTKLVGDSFTSGTIALDSDASNISDLSLNGPYVKFNWTF